MPALLCHVGLTCFAALSLVGQATVSHGHCYGLVTGLMGSDVVCQVDWLTRVFSQHLQISDAFREVFNSWKLYERSYQFYLVHPRLSSLAATIYTMTQHTSHGFETRPD